MKIGELVEILRDYPEHLEVKLATDRFTGPWFVSLRGVVTPTVYGPVYLCADYDNRRLESDLWAELDGPMFQKGESDDEIAS